MRRNLAVLAGMSVGAGMMLLLDPAAGARRRARLRERALRSLHNAENAGGATARDVQGTCLRLCVCVWPPEQEAPRSLPTESCA